MYKAYLLQKNDIFTKAASPDGYFGMHAHSVVSNLVAAEKAQSSVRFALKTFCHQMHVCSPTPTAWRSFRLLCRLFDWPLQYITRLHSAPPCVDI